MTAGYYKNHIDYNKHVSYGKSVSYGRHINYNKPAVDLCNQSSYWNGVEFVNVDFVSVAPLRMDLDGLSANGKTTNLKSMDWECILDANIVFSEQSNTAKYIRHFSSVDANTLFNIDVGLVDPDTARFILRDSLNSPFYSATLTLNGLELNQLKVTYVNATGLLSVYQDDLLLDSQVVSYSGNFSVDNYAIGYSSVTGLDNMIMLLSGYSLTGVGTTDFKSNQDDGLTFLSSEDLLWTLTEDIPWSAQIKPDGTSSTAYTWPASVVQEVPLTGDITINGDLVGVRNGTFVNVKSSVYSDGATDEIEGYTLEGDVYAPTVDGADLNNGIILTSTGSQGYDYVAALDGVEYRESFWYYTAIDGNQDSIYVVNSTTTDGLIALNHRADGKINLLVIGNNDLQITTFNSQNALPENQWVKISVAIKVNTTDGSRRDFGLYFDDVLEFQAAFRDVSGGLVFNRTYCNFGSSEGKIKEIRSNVRQVAGNLLQKGAWYFNSRLLPNGENQLQYVNIGNGEIMSSNSALCRYPNLGTSYYNKEEIFNG